jgi:hypothetical protein
MSTPVNLNKARKAKARAEKKARADQNALSFGLTKSEKSAATVSKDREKTQLDQHKLDPSD